MGERKGKGTDWAKILLGRRERGERKNYLGMDSSGELNLKEVIEWKGKF